MNHPSVRRAEDEPIHRIPSVFRLGKPATFSDFTLAPFCLRFWGATVKVLSIPVIRRGAALFCLL